MNGWRLAKPEYGITLECDRLRRERNELIGELTVQCDMAGAQTVNGFLSTGDFNFSSPRARKERANLLKERANTNGKLDWYGLLEEFVQGVFARERLGEPVVDLRTIARPTADDLVCQGLTFPRRHPSILFGDGGSAKSYTALFVAGELIKQGLTVGLFDWELCGEDHRDRLERMYGPLMPKILYCRCERPFTYEVDRLRRIVTENHIQYAIFDSVAFACDGPPEAAEIAGKYFRALREIECGSLHIAHSTKGENNDQKPFGSVFWHNGARSIWHSQATDPIDEEPTLQIALTHKKNNLGRLRPPVSYLINFAQDRTIFSKQDLNDNPNIVLKRTVKQRMYSVLKHGSMTMEEIAEAIEETPASVKTTAYRARSTFIVLAGGRVGLVER